MSKVEKKQKEPLDKKSTEIKKVKIVKKKNKEKYLCRDSICKCYF